MKRLSIFGRTFLLMLAALVLAVGVGVALLLTRPPMHNAPVRLSEIARLLSFALDRGLMDRGTLDHERRGRGMGPPPGEFVRETDQSLPGPTGPLRPPPQAMLPPRREWQIREQADAPSAPAGTDRVASDHLRSLLALRIGVGEERVRIFVAEAPREADSDDPQLREGFVAAWITDFGKWRVMQGVVEGFPNAFQRQVLWLFGIGLVVLLPVSWWFARALAAPIRRFSAGARRLGTDPHAPALEREGTTEMLEAIDSFNAMQGRITRLLQERSQMIGAIAHDLRTPLMRLAFRVDSLQSPLREKVEADINEMKLMISAALDFLRDQAAGGSRERLDLRLLVESVVDDQSDVGHDVTLVSGEPVVLRADPLSLRRMVVNLVDNALKYGERARLRLRAERGNVTLEIDDDGPGIPDNLQQRVFEPFSARSLRATGTPVVSGSASPPCGPSSLITVDILSSEIARTEAFA